MKKFIIFLVVPLFFLGFFSFNVDSTNAQVSLPTVSSITKNLDVGSRGSEVKKLQQFLKDEGYYTGRIDGIYGKKTSRYVKDFQDDNDLDATGRIDAQTRALINSMLIAGSGEILPIDGQPCPYVGDGNLYYRKCNDNSPTISKVSGPQSLELNQEGTWTISASSPNAGNLSYYVVWGDEDPVYGINNQSMRWSPTVQSGTFTHVYTRAGTYTPTFTVVSENTIYCIKAPCGNEGKAQVSLSVTVGNGLPTVPLLKILNSSYLPNARVGDTYALTFEANFIKGAKYNWRLISGDSPTTVFDNIRWGNSCNTDVCGQFTGIPKVAGTYIFTIQVLAGGQKATKDFTLVIDPASQNSNNVVTIRPANKTKSYTAGQNSVVIAEFTFSGSAGTKETFNVSSFWPFMADQYGNYYQYGASNPTHFRNFSLWINGIKKSEVYSADQYGVLTFPYTTNSDFTITYPTKSQMVIKADVVPGVSSAKYRFAIAGYSYGSAIIDYLDSSSMVFSGADSEVKISGINNQIVTTDSDNSPDYLTVGIPYNLSPQTNPELFTRGVGKGFYVGSGPGAPYHIFGSNDGSYYEVRDTTDPYDTYNDNCMDANTLQEAYINTQGNLSAHGIGAPKGYQCKNGAFVLTGLDPSINMILYSGNRSTDGYMEVKVGDDITFSGVPQNLQGLSYWYGNGYPPTGYFNRAFFFDQSFSNNNMCGNNEASTDKAWTFTCTAKVTGSTYFYVEIYANGKVYKSNTINVVVNPKEEDVVTPGTLAISPSSIAMDVSGKQRVTATYTTSCTATKGTGCSGVSTEVSPTWSISNTAVAQLQQTTPRCAVGYTCAKPTTDVVGVAGGTTTLTATYQESNGNSITKSISVYIAPIIVPIAGNSLCKPMTEYSAVRGCSNYREQVPVYKADSASCVNYCQSQKANACEWDRNTGSCYVEFGTGCYVESGFGGWNASVDSCQSTAYVPRSSMLTANVLGSLDINKPVKNTQTSAGATPSQSFRFTQFLEQGSYGQEVRELQRLLNSKGYDVGKVDGVFGLKVKEMLIKFQGDNGLKADGILGYEMRSFLNK